MAARWGQNDGILRSWARAAIRQRRGRLVSRTGPPCAELLSFRLDSDRMPLGAAGTSGFPGVGRAPRFDRGRDPPPTPARAYSTSRYPMPCSVSRCAGAEGSASSFFRSCDMYRRRYPESATCSLAQISFSSV